MLKVFREPCRNCLLSKTRIVSAKRANQIIRECVTNNAYFICHKASIEGQDVMCSAFFKTLGHKLQIVRIAERLDAIEFVAQSDNQKLLTFEEMQNT